MEEFLKNRDNKDLFGLLSEGVSPMEIPPFIYSFIYSLFKS